MVRGFLDDLGLLVRYEVKENEIVQYYSSGKTQVVPFEDSADRNAYIYMLDETIAMNKNEIVRLTKEKNLNASLSKAKEDLEKHIFSGKLKIIGILGGIAIAPLVAIKIASLIEPSIGETTMLLSATGVYGLEAGIIAKVLSVHNKKGRKLQDIIENYKDQIDDIEEERKEEKELELSKKLEGFNFEKNMKSYQKMNM